MRRLWAFAAAMGGVLLIAASSHSDSKHVDVITLDDVINPATADFILDSIATAEEDGAECLIVQLDTPGGLVDSTRDIVKGIFAADVPVVIYVAPSGARAGSAGVFITMASHVAVMAPGTNIGAAHPVSGSGEDIGGEMEKKVINDTAAGMQAWATERGRNAEWAVKAVRESVSITEKKALKINVVDLISPSLEDLLNQIDGRTVKVRSGEVTLATKGATMQHLSMNLKQRIVATISRPNVAYLLLLVGMAGLFLEYTHPGTLVPGIVGAICLILFFAVQSLPINYIGLLLMLLAIGLFVAEVFVTSFGLLSIAGIAALIMGSLLLFDTPQAAFPHVSWSAIIPTVALVATGTLLLGIIVLKGQLGKVRTGQEGLVGEEGIARTVVMGTEGSVFVHGEIWNATSAQPIPEGSRVRVVKVNNLRMEVEPFSSETSES